MNRKSVIFIIPLIALVLMSCRISNITLDQQIINGSGTLKTESRQVSDIERISLEDIGDLTIIQGEEESLRVEADDNLLQYIETTMRGRELVLKIKDGYTFSDVAAVNYTLTLKDLSRVSVAGAGNITAEKLNVGDLELTVAGTGNVKINDLQAKNLRAETNGSGNFDLQGAVEEQDLTINGAGNYTAGDLQSKQAKVTITGAGNVTVWATESLDVHISGFGNVNYYGSPKVEESIAGGGGVKSLGDHK